MDERVSLDPNPTTEDFSHGAQAVADDLIAEAERGGDQPEAGLLWCCAGELHEFGTGDRETAFRCYGKAATHPSAPAQSFAGLRRLTRSAGRSEQLGELYRIECDAAGSAEQRVRAAAQWAVWLIRNGDHTQLGALDEILRESESSDTWVSALGYVIRQDMALVQKAYGEAAEIQVSRLAVAEAQLPETGSEDDRELSEMAAAIAMTHRYLTGDREAAASWFDRSFRWQPSESALHALGSVGWMEKMPAEYERRIQQLIESEPASWVSARQCRDLAMLRAFRLGDREAAGTALRDGMAHGPEGIVNAFDYTGFSRAEPGLRTPDEMVDALGVRAEHAATNVERADALYQMAVIFDAEMGLPDAAIELLRESLSVKPSFRPAAKALSRMYQRRGSWDLLAELLEAEVSADRDTWRARMRLAEIYQDRLLIAERAEPHLKAVLNAGYYEPASQRLSTILQKQGRWEELLGLRMVAAEAETDARERLHHLERAAELAEHKLSKLEVAVDCWRSVHEIDPLHPGCLSALGRLLRQLGRWEDLVSLNQDEIAVRDEPDARARLWTDNGNLYAQHLNDETNAQQCFELALEVLPTYEPALEGLGRILWNNEDWDALVEMFTAEINALAEGARRTRRMLDLGELQATRAGQPEAALATFQTVFRCDPECEEALLWMERLHQAACSDARVLAVLERRVKLASEESRAVLVLRAASLAEWAVQSPTRAWPYYLEALGDSATRPHALAGLGRIWPHIVDDESAVTAALEALTAALHKESRPELMAEISTLEKVLARGARTLTDWAEVYEHAPGDVVARAAAEVTAAVDGDLDRLASLRRDRRCGALWAMVVASDKGSVEGIPPKDKLPVSGTVTDLLAELDAIDSATTDEEALRAVEFRGLVRAWSQGNRVPQPSAGHASIPALRLSSHAALEAGDQAAASEFTEQEARAWSDQSTIQRRLVVAAQLRHPSNAEAARTLLSSALDLGCFDKDSRVRLYDALDGLGELELLIEGLNAHVGQCTTPEARLPWLNRLASVCERNGDCNGALAAFQSILELQPADAIALMEQTRLLTLEGLLDEARRTLDRALRRQFPMIERLGLLSRLADLQLMEDGDGSKAVTALEEATDLAGRTQVWVRRLARAHYAHGEPERAVALLVESLPKEFTETDLPDWFLLARLKYQRLDDQDGARELLWGMMEAFPGNLDVLGELEVYHRRVGSARELADRLSTMLLNSSDGMPSAPRAFLWEYVGDINYRVLRRNRDAEVAYEAALSAGGPPGALSLKAARAVAQQPGKGREACQRFSAVLQHPRVGLQEWRDVVGDLEALFEGTEDQARLRVIRQVRSLLWERPNAGADEARIKRDPGREIAIDDALEKMTDGLLSKGSLGLIRVMLPLLERCFRDRRPRKRALGGRRFKGGEAQDFLGLVQTAAEALAISTPKLYVSTDVAHPEWIAGGFILPQAALEISDELTLRFWAGHTVGSCAFEVSPLALAQPGEIESLLAETLRLEAGGTPSEEGIFKEVAAGRHAALRQRVVESLEADPSLLERIGTEDWAQLPVRLADWFGLLFTGDAAVAVSAILSIDGELRPGDGPSRAVSEARARTLLKFSLGTAYHEVRYLAGLGARPRIL